MKNSIHIATAVGVWALLLGGCGNFSAKPDPSRFFTLSALPAPEDAAKKTPADSSGHFSGHRADYFARISRSPRNRHSGGAEPNQSGRK